MTELSLSIWILVGMGLFAGVSILTALALFWAGSTDETDLANDYWRDV